MIKLVMAYVHSLKVKEKGCIKQQFTVNSRLFDNNVYV